MSDSVTKSDAADDDKSQKKPLLILSIVFIIILLLLVILVLISLFLIYKNGETAGDLLGRLTFRSNLEEEDEDDTCLPPKCIATCYKTELKQRIGPYYDFRQPFDVLKTRLKLNLTILRDVQIGVNLVSPLNRYLWHVTIRLDKKYVVLNFQATENSWNENRTVIINVTNIKVGELFTLYATPIPGPKDDELFGFQFDVQPLNKTKVELGSIASPLKPGEQNGTYRVAIYGPVLLSAYCTEVPQ